VISRQFLYTLYEHIQNSKTTIPVSVRRQNLDGY
jgi:hypothetical protein